MGHDDHHPGRGGRASNAVETWRMKETIRNVIKNGERGPSCAYLSGGRVGEERRPPLTNKMERSSLVTSAKPKPEKKEIIKQGMPSKKEEAGRQRSKKDQEERRKNEEEVQPSSSSDSIETPDICNSKLLSIPTYQKGGGAGTWKGSWQKSSPSSTDPGAPPSCTSSSCSVDLSAKPPFNFRRTPYVDLPPNSIMADNTCRGTDYSLGGTKTTERPAGTDNKGKGGKLF